jgi:3-oxoacid CoA-transferase B subunit
MDLAVGAKNVFLAMEQVTREGKSRLVERCALPVTARGVVKLVITNLGLFQVTPEGFVLREIAPGIAVDQVKAQTAGRLSIPDKLQTVRV